MDTLRRHGLQRIERFVLDDDGASATEYAILLGVLVLGAMASIQSIGTNFRGVYMAIASKIPTDG